MGLIGRHEQSLSLIYGVIFTSYAHIESSLGNKDYLRRNVHMDVAKNVFVPFRHKKIGIMKLHESEIHFLSSD
jgi:hypothetical protein